MKTLSYAIRWTISLLIFVFGTACLFTANENPPTNASPTESNTSERQSPTDNSGGAEIQENDAVITIPTESGTAPTDVQAQIRWFDGGAQLCNDPSELIHEGDPQILIEGTLIADNTITLRYKNFEPNEILTIIWYNQVNARGEIRNNYWFSWKYKMDEHGNGSQRIYIPQDICVRDIVLAAKGKNSHSNWIDSGCGFVLDVEATAITTANNYELNCPNEMISDAPVDNSSRFSELKNQGEIQIGETKKGNLSLSEAHDWIIQAQKGDSLAIKLEFQHNDFPVDRISILDPNGKLVYECSDLMRGCSQVTNLSIVSYTPSTSGKYTIRIDRFSDGDGSYSLTISSDTRPESESPSFESVIIDDNSSQISWKGPDSGWRTAPYGYRNSTHWTYCTDQNVSNWAQWTPRLPSSGNYEVFVYVPEHKAGTQQAHYKIIHNNDTDEVTIAQANYSNEWVSLGIYKFSGTGNEYVYLADNTGESRSKNITIAFDAVKFVYQP